MSIVDDIKENGQLVKIEELYGKLKVVVEGWYIPQNMLTPFFVYFRLRLEKINVWKNKRDGRWYIVSKKYTICRNLSIVIGDLEFLSKTELLKYCRNLASKNRVFDSADEKFLIALLKYHPYCEEKIGCGIKEFFSCMNDYQSGYEFRFNRTDGTVDNFSYYYIADTIYLDK